ncbi:hypothetical protein BU23DRAFT_635964 [Bimuria novae-zelandiae CBS 107.79]|uniref:Uncharacterized protein n=1 Tax=Bimuria novae-zelandiae CBS 107.79 TaxID=1447943 RepID=A0A6A5VBD2_9PLEO|nr:hypothetical protein BU23DRAFT_635964 [Bimuria novae-zelandiae CBS 107.79]
MSSTISALNKFLKWEAQRISQNPFKSFTTVFASGTFVATAIYTTSLSHAPLVYDPPSVSFSIAQMLYLVPPGVTVILYALEVNATKAVGLLGGPGRLALAIIMFLGWLLTTVLWGRCHFSADKEPKVCYQHSLEKSSYGFVEGVSEPLGHVVFALGVVMIVHLGGASDLI